MIALFRGINVGGKNTIAMKHLVELFQRLGCTDVRTYIQSGNVVFDCNEEVLVTLLNKVSEEISSAFGFKPFILLLAVEEIEKAIAQNPFPEAVNNPQSLHVGFLSAVPTTPNLVRLAKLKTNSEQFQLIGKVFYLFAPEGVGRSKLAAGAEKSIGVPMTDRNWKTVCKISAMAKGVLKT